MYETICLPNQIASYKQMLYTMLILFVSPFLNMKLWYVSDIGSASFCLDLFNDLFLMHSILNEVFQLLCLLLYKRVDETWNYPASWS